MFTPPPNSLNHTSSNSLSHLVQTTLSYNTNVMLAAIISLLLVILFVLLLHLYAKWFLAQARHRSRNSVTVPRHVLGSRFHRFTIIDTISDHSPTKGLHPSAIASIPLFVYRELREESKHGLECAICLSVFEEEEVVRKLPECHHAFHVECIDMWLHSHSTCPICRAGIECRSKMNVEMIGLRLNIEEQGGGFLTRREESVVQLEISVAGDEVLNLENESLNNNYVGNNDSESGCSSSSLGGSLKRLLSSSSRSGGKIHPSIDNAGDLEG